MVKKKFRPFVMGAVMSMSSVLAMSSVASVCVTAAEATEIVQEAETEMTVQEAKEAETEAPAAETEAVAQETEEVAPETQSAPEEAAPVQEETAEAAEPATEAPAEVQTEATVQEEAVQNTEAASQDAAAAEEAVSEILPEASAEPVDDNSADQTAGEAGNVADTSNAASNDAGTSDDANTGNDQSGTAEDASKDDDSAEAGTDEGKTEQEDASKETNIQLDAKLTGDKTSCEVGDLYTVTATVNSVKQLATQEISIDVPAHLEFSETSIPSDASVNDGNLSMAYVMKDGSVCDQVAEEDKANVTSVLFVYSRSATDHESADSMGSSWTVKFKAVEEGTTQCSCSYYFETLMNENADETVTDDMRVSRKEAKADTLTISAKQEEENEPFMTATTIKISQDKVAPARNVEVKQTVNVTYGEDVDSSVIDYLPAQEMTVKSLSLAAGSVLDGANAVITTADGPVAVKLSSSNDFSMMKGISRIAITPVGGAMKGEEAAFIVTFAVNDSVKKFSTLASVEVSLNEQIDGIADVFESELSYCDVYKPVMEYGTKPVAFGDEFEIKLDGIAMGSSGKVGNYVYNIAVPSFVTVDTLKMPKLTGVKSISVLLTDGKTEYDFGEIDPKETEVEIGKSGLTNIVLIIVPEGNEILTEKAGSLIMTNDIEDHNESYFAFNVLAENKDSETVYGSNSSILGVTFEHYTEKEEQPTQGGDKPVTPGPVMPDDDGNEIDPGTDDEDDTDDGETGIDEVIEEILKKQEEKQKEEALLAARVDAIKNSATGSLSSAGASGSDGDDAETSTEGEKTDPRSDRRYYVTDDQWKVIPVDEAIIGSAIPRVTHISEDIVTVVRALEDL